MIRPITIFSFFHNCKLYFKDNKIVDLEKSVNVNHYNRLPEYVSNSCSKVVGRINNNHFSFYDFKIYVFKMYMFYKSVTWKKIDLNNVSETKTLFSNDRYKNDKKLIENLLEKLNSDTSYELSVHNLFDVNANGNSILLDLILDGVVSPMYYIMQYDKNIGKANLTKYEVSDSLIRINSTTEKINKYLRSKK